MKILEKKIAACDKLSRRERQVAQMVINKGLSIRESAYLLGVSRRTIRTYLTRVYAKFGL